MDSASSQHNNGGSSRKPKMRVMTPHETIHVPAMTKEELEENQEEEMEETDPEEELEEETDPEEESEEEPEEEIDPEEEEYPNNPNEVTTPVEEQHSTPSYGSADPYIKFLQELKGKASSSFPPYQGEIPSIKEQAQEIQEQNEAANAFFNYPSDETTTPYPDPKDHYDVVMMGYRDPPPRYGYPTDIPRSQEEHLDRALQETDELRKKIVEDKKKKKKVT
ncbi:uncharacterized protein LOC143598229 [Bidens hawaiensis]|uniref:uncharacterized protein LOC143598229 n=1 Tax=Bidens hawaiensis TaxID=980011 RepID=UPI0040499DEB